ncbi:MAG: hypothetical protein KIT81_07000 [Alphaproteobacteria bacterium]|nr:hypothetical protein [Alphaproteobacteria bacterium]
MYTRPPEGGAGFALSTLFEIFLAFPTPERLKNLGLVARRYSRAYDPSLGGGQ